MRREVGKEQRLEDAAGRDHSRENDFPTCLCGQRTGQARSKVTGARVGAVACY